MKFPISSSQFPIAKPREAGVRPIGNRQSAIGNAAAFTMIEIAICLAIIGFALVAIIGVLPLGMNTQRDNREETIINQDATVLLPPTSSVHIASRRLSRFDTGGKTPLAQGLLAARDVVMREKARDKARRCLVVVLTDGRATGGPDPLGRARIAAARLVTEGAAAVVVDCETSFVRLGLAEELARHLDAPAVRLSQLKADNLGAVVRTAA